MLIQDVTPLSEMLIQDVTPLSEMLIQDVTPLSGRRSHIRDLR